MARSRIEMRDYLEQMLRGVNAHLYFQPPENTEMSYPAVRYSLDGIDNKSANNSVYTQFRTYQLIVIDKNPDGMIADKISKLPRCKFDRHYSRDNLNHWVFTLQY